MLFHFSALRIPCKPGHDIRIYADFPLKKSIYFAFFAVFSITKAKNKVHFLSPAPSTQTKTSVSSQRFLSKPYFSHGKKLFTDSSPVAKPLPTEFEPAERKKQVLRPPASRSMARCVALCGIFTGMASKDTSEHEIRRVGERVAKVKNRTICTRQNI